ncbi:MAG TPA: hypothetical protein VFX30_07680 [bacterium]|nr:hypothetical protein [bacterium]
MLILGAMMDTAQLAATQAALLRSTSAPAENWLMGMQRAGFLSDGVVRTLDRCDGLLFIDETEKNLPPGWDLLDAFARLDFGPWTTDGPKDVNASLRSLGMFDQRWQGSKLSALWHPIPSRATALMDHERLLREGAFDAAGLMERFPSARTLWRRLAVEIYALDVYLDHGEWHERLWPDRSLKDRERLAADIIRRTRPTLAAADRLALALGQIPSPVVQSDS